jgi:flagellar protein FlgJ
MLPIDTGANVSKVQDSYLDPNSLNSIKAMGRDKDPQALKEVAKKFEAMFVQQMLKTMREANEAFGEGNYFDSQTTRFHRDMLDQQMVLNLTSGSGIGLADHFYKQMLQNYGAGMKPESASANGGEMGEFASPVEHRNSHPQTPADVAADELDSWIDDFIRMSDNSHLQSIFSQAENDNPDNAGQIPATINYALIPALLRKHQYPRPGGGKKTIIPDQSKTFCFF